MAFPTQPKKLAIANRRKQVAEMLLRGRTQTAIAAELGIDRKTVYSDLLAVRKQVTDDAKGALEGKRALDLAKLQRVESEAWDAWERSKHPRTRKNAKKTRADTTGARDETSVMEEGRDGNDKFLARVESAVMNQAKLDGLLKDQIELTGKDGAPVPIRVVEIVRPTPKPEAPHAEPAPAA